MLCNQARYLIIISFVLTASVYCVLLQLMTTASIVGKKNAASKFSKKCLTSDEKIKILVWWRKGKGAAGVSQNS